MKHAKPLGPFCQSCGMPMEKPKDFGTDVTGYRVNDFCHWCFSNGVFINPDMTLPQMIDKCVEAMTARGLMPAAEARALMTDVLPKLKRWRAPVMAL